MKFITLFLILISTSVSAQIVHSHNDYDAKIPFYEAYTKGAGSIEVDIFLEKGVLKVCHDINEVKSAKSIEELYLDPIKNAYAKGKEIDFILMIDLKTDYKTTLPSLIKSLKKYDDIFISSGIKVVVSGSRPPVSEFKNYPAFISFDGRHNENYTSQEMERIRMISAPMSDFTQWNGKGSIPPKELDVIKDVITFAHNNSKPVRFWSTKDNVNTWVTLAALGVDIINSDKIAECTNFFRNYESKSYTLSTPQPTYTPTYQNDGENTKPKNIILIIGDGMSLTQITAAETANRGMLTLLNMKNIGFQKTSALNSYNTDSAGAGTALSTGQKTNNRHISTGADGAQTDNMCEKLMSTGKKVGIISSGDVTDATPAAFYSHSIERDNSEEIASWLPQQNISLLVGTNKSPFTNRKDSRNILNEMTKKGFSVIDDKDSLSFIQNNVICLDEKVGEWSTESTINSLAEITKESLRILDNNNGLFLMIESAKIDHAGHSNNIKSSILETMKLDAVVAEALKFADKNKETLVIVTGDHETGGMVLLDGDRSTGKVTTYYASDDHTGVLLPVFTYGLSSREFNGTYENCTIPQKIIELIGNNR